MLCAPKSLAVAGTRYYPRIELGALPASLARLDRVRKQRLRIVCGVRAARVSNVRVPVCFVSRVRVCEIGLIGTQHSSAAAQHGECN